MKHKKDGSLQQLQLTKRDHPAIVVPIRLNLIWIKEDKFWAAENEELMLRNCDSSIRKVKRNLAEDIDIDIDLHLTEDDRPKTPVTSQFQTALDKLKAYVDPTKRPKKWEHWIIHEADEENTEGTEKYCLWTVNEDSGAIEKQKVNVKTISKELTDDKWFLDVDPDDLEFEYEDNIEEEADRECEEAEREAAKIECQRNGMNCQACNEFNNELGACWWEFDLEEKK
jgi:hypothetical protein